MKFFGLVVALSLLVGCCAGSGQLYGLVQPHNQLVKVTSSPLTVTPVATIGDAWGSPFGADTTRSIVYSTYYNQSQLSGENLYSYSLTTAAPVYFVNMSQQLPYVAPPGFDWEFANLLEVDSTTGLVYVINSQQKSHSVNPSTNVWQVNPVTGSIRLVVNILSTSSVHSAYGGSALDSNSGLLYLTLESGANSTSYLYTVNIARGTYSRIGPIAEVNDTYDFDYVRRKLVRFEPDDYRYSPQPYILNWVNPSTGTYTVTPLWINSDDDWAYTFGPLSYDFAGRRGFTLAAIANAVTSANDYYLLTFNIDNGQLITKELFTASQGNPPAVFWWIPS